MLAVTGREPRERADLNFVFYFLEREKNEEHYCWIGEML